jgi:porphobilinogen deaminase
VLANVKNFRLGSRGSTLALAQAHWVKARIEGKRPELKVELVDKTSGDALSTHRFKPSGAGVLPKRSKGCSKEIDLAVHSRKTPNRVARPRARRSSRA